MKKEMKERLKLSAAIALLIAMTFCGFGPLEMIMAGASEFWFSVTDVLLYVCVCVVICFGIVFVVSYLIGTKVKLVYPILLGFGIAMYVQGNFMFVSYGIMDGTAIDWNSFGMWPIINTLIWVFLIAIPIILYLLKKEWFKEVAVVLPIIIVAMQLITLGTLALTTDLNKEASGGSLSLSVKGIDEVSEKGNVALFIVDTFEDVFIEELLENEPEFLKPLDGFTYFSNSTGMYPSTKGAMPFILTGQKYYNEQPYTEYVQEAYTKTDYYKDLKNAGYDISVYAEHVYTNSDAVSDYISNLDRTSKLKASSNIGLMGTIYKATAFRYFPHVAKKTVWYHTGDFDKWKMSAGESGYALHTTGNLDFYEDIKDKLHLVKTDDCFYKVFFVWGAHPPYELQEDLTENKDGTVTYMQTAKGCLNIIYEYIEQLKELGVYDQTTIIMIADHGRTKMDFTSPVFLAKPQNTRGAIKISNAPVSQEDLLATVMEDLGLNEDGKYGRSAFDWEEGEDRKRTYLYYDWAQGSWDADYLPEMLEYEISPENNDPASFYPLDYEKTKYELGNIISFDAENPTAQPYCIRGIRGFEQGSSWISDVKACMAFQINEEIQENLTVEIDVISVYGDAQDVTISMGNDVLFQKVMDTAEKIQFTIPAEKIKDGEIELNFDLPNSVSPYERGESQDTRILSLRISSLVIQNTTD